MALESINEGSLTDEQTAVYQQIIANIESSEGQIFFLVARDGTGNPPGLLLHDWTVYGSKTVPGHVQRGGSITAYQTDCLGRKHYIA